MGGVVRACREETETMESKQQQQDGGARHRGRDLYMLYKREDLYSWSTGRELCNHTLW